MTELFVAAENGQLEVNWESLVLVTSEDFVKRVKRNLNPERFFNELPFVASVYENKDCDEVEVLINDDGIIGCFIFNTLTKESKCSWFGSPDLKRMVEALGGEIVWKK